MIPRLIRSGVLAAIAGAAMAFAVSSSPSFAFSLSSPSVTEQGFKTDVQEIYYYRRHYYRPYYHHYYHPYYHHYYRHYYYHPYYHPLLPPLLLSSLLLSSVLLATTVHYINVTGTAAGGPIMVARVKLTGGRFPRSANSAHVLELAPPSEGLRRRSSPGARIWRKRHSILNDAYVAWICAFDSGP